ncbi:MAG: C45 family autoproteolytic acyltransferase/hydrolase [bacterium]|nr:C45 family autoproteolytic acyltransferase/hydrolase [bacterium]
MPLTFTSLREDDPGPRWQALFEASWPGYKAWFLSEGYRARPGYLTCLMKLQEHMPELIPLYERLVSLAGGSDVAARFLSMYSPPPYMTGCSQAAWTRGSARLVRNYDFSPRLFEGNLLYTAWNRRVIAMSDCLWGVLDGLNDAGVAVSLAFGGRQVVGEGFGFPLVLRYVLEFCDSTAAAVAALERVPVHMAYSATVVDRDGVVATVHVSPDRPTVVTDSPVCTNHQEQVEWEAYARFTETLERRTFMAERLADVEETEDRFVRRFHRSPLYHMQYEKAFGTLYTAVYSPREGEAAYLWPGHSGLKQTFEAFTEGRTLVSVRRARSKMI